MTSVPELPVPPPFMWACTTCTGFLAELGTAFMLSTQHALYDGSARCQLLLAHHLATMHSGEIPGPHEDCQPCAYYEKRADAQGLHDLWLEHRARDLFLPESDARLL